MNQETKKTFDGGQKIIFSDDDFRPNTNGTDFNDIDIFLFKFCLSKDQICLLLLSGNFCLYFKI